MQKVALKATYPICIFGGHVGQSSPRDLLSIAHLFLLLLELKSVMSTWIVSESFAVGTYPTAYLSRRVKTSLMPTAVNLRAYLICSPVEAPSRSKPCGWAFKLMPLNSIPSRISSNSVRWSTHRNMAHHW